MKKSVVILIALIYIASIALVSFFGLQYKTFNPIVYTTSVEILNENVKVNDAGEKYVVVRADEHGNRQFQILYRVHPDNATNNEVSFAYDDQNGTVSVDENGVVTFSKEISKGVVTVQLIAKDGSGASAKITIYSR